MEPLLRDRLTLAAVLGAGVVIGVSGLYMYFKLNGRGVTRELTHLTRTIENLRRDIEDLKVTSDAAKVVRLQQQQPDVAGCPASGAVASVNGGGPVAAVKQQRSRSWSADRTDGGAASVLSSGEDDEYFDVSDDGDMGQSWAPVNGDATAVADEPLQPLFDEIDRLCDGDSLDQQTAYDKLIGDKDANVSNPEFMWRLAKTCYFCSITAASHNDKERQKQMIFDGVRYSAMALAMDDSSAEIHKWYAVLIGRTTDFIGIQEKIKNGHTFKEHVDLAISLQPDDHSLYFMKGRWCYEVAMLSWVERKVASTLFAVPPTSSFAEAREQFLMVEKMKSGEWKENTLYIAKCFVAEGDYAGAMEWLDKAAAIRTTSADDSIAQKEVDELIKKYSGYRDK